MTAAPYVLLLARFLYLYEMDTYSVLSIRKHVTGAPRLVDKRPTRSHPARRNGAVTDAYKLGIAHLRT